jgi:hypothetical protein
VKSSLILIFVFICNLAFATILTVDNRVPSGGQYSTFQAAYDAAADGDSIYLFPSPLAYTPVNISKQIHIFGGGFNYLFESSGMYNTEFNNNFSFQTGSAASSISGVKVNSSLQISDSDIRISNCYTIGALLITSNNTTVSKSKVSGVQISSSNVLINKCYIYGPGYYYNSVYYGIRMDMNTSATVSNSIIDIPSTGNYGFFIRSGCQVMINGNYIGRSDSESHALLLSEGVSVTNNIIMGNITGTYYSYFANNILSGDYVGVPPTNLTQVDVPALFVDWSNKDFHLAPGSLANGAGEGGIDCGPYGGASPFNDNYNISPLPSIIELHAPTVVFQPKGPCRWKSVPAPLETKGLIMKFCLLLIICLSSVISYAAILTVDNNIPSTSPYIILQTAYYAAADGDTIYVIPSNTPYQGISVNRHLHFIGTGWLPQGNDGVFIKNTRISGSMNFTQEADGSSIEGFGGQFSVQTYADNTSIIGCQLTQLRICTSGLTYSAYNTLVMNNVIVTTGAPLYIYRPEFSLQLINNILVSTGSSYTIFTNGEYITGSSSICNNTFKSASLGYLTQNNTNYSDATVINNIVTSNILQTSQSIHDNILGSDAVNCISTDYHTVPGSAAIDAGFNNEAYNDLDGSQNDCGAYGGPTPFLDGGIPGYPAIYEINGPGVATPNETIPVQIKAKTNRD